MPLSKYEQLFNLRQRRQVVELLHHKIDLTIDKKYLIDPQDVNLGWTINRHFLDFSAVVGRHIGFGPLFPGVASQSTFVARFDLLRGYYRRFKAKYTMLGFDPQHRMLYVGMHGVYEMWIAMHPRSDPENDALGDPELSGSDAAAPDSGGAGQTKDDKVDTRLLPAHRSAIIMFLFHCLDKIPDRPSILTHQYGPLRRPSHKGAHISELNVENCTQLR